MGELGTNIDRNIDIPELREDPHDLALLGTDVVRYPYSPWIPFEVYRNYNVELSTFGIKNQIVFDRASMNDYDWNNADYSEADEFGVNFLANIQSELDGYVHYWQLGNEPDIESPSSWTMNPDRFVHLLKVGHYVFGRDQLVAGGLAGGNPDWVRGLGIEQYVARGAFHPYGQGTPDFPSPYGFGGDVVQLGAGYVDAANGLEFDVTEFGSNINELGVEFGTEYAVNVLKWLKDMGNVNQFGLRNYVDGFGMYDSDNNPRPLYWEFQRLANDQTTFEFARANVVDSPIAVASMIGRRGMNRIRRPKPNMSPAALRSRSPVPQLPNRYGTIIKRS